MTVTGVMKRWEPIIHIPDNLLLEPIAGATISVYFSSSVAEESWLLWLGGGHEGLSRRGNEIEEEGEGLQVPVVSWWGVRGPFSWGLGHHRAPGGCTGGECYWGYLHVGLSLSPKAVLLQQKIDKPPSQTDGVHSQGPIIRDKNSRTVERGG